MKFCASALSTISFYLLFAISPLFGQNCQRSEVIADYQENFVNTFLYNSQIDWTGSVSSCEAGSIPQEVKDKALTRINYFRRLVGVSDNIVWNDAKNNKCQQMALMIKANGLSHNPPSNWNCYTSAGAEAAGQSNLAFFNAVEAMEKWISDSGVPSVGHRRWMLYPKAVEMGIGSTNNSSSLWVIGNFEEPDIYPEYTAYPSPGYFPEALEFPLWSFSKDQANFSGSRVEMYDENGNEIKVDIQPLGYGQADNTIVFVPQSKIVLNEINGIDTYIKVKISNIRLGTQSLDYEYEVLLIPETFTQPELEITDQSCDGDDLGSCRIIYPHGYSKIEWSTGASDTDYISDLTIGLYSVTVTDKLGCDKEYNFIIEEETSNVSALISTDGPTSFCEGESLSLIAEGEGNINWSTGSTANIISINSEGYYHLSITNEEGCTASDSIYIQQNSIPELSIESSMGTAICEGTSTTLTAKGSGIFSWSTGANIPSVEVSNSGAYSVIITDNNGCTNEAVFELSSIERPKANMIGVQEELSLCSGDSITIIGEGGAYYEWSTGSVNQEILINSTGRYTLTVTDAFGCTNSTSVEVNVYSSPSAQINEGKTEISACLGDTILLQVNSNDSLLWSTGESQAAIEVTSPGTYVLTVTNSNSCTSSDNIEVILSPLPEADIQSSNAPILCEGDSLELFVDVNDSINWSTNDQTSSIHIYNPGTYQVTITDTNGCSNHDQIEVDDGATAMIDNILGNENVLAEQLETYLIQSMDNFQETEWSIFGGNILSEPSNSEVEVSWNKDFSEGELCARLLSEDECLGISFCKSINIQAVNTNDLNELYIKLNPIPCHNYLNIEGNTQSIDQILLYDLNGKLILKKSFSNKLDVSGLSNGMYILGLYSDSNLKLLKKLVKGSY